MHRSDARLCRAMGPSVSLTGVDSSNTRPVSNKGGGPRCFNVFVNREVLDSLLNVLANGLLVFPQIDLHVSFKRC